MKKLFKALKRSYSKIILFEVISVLLILVALISIFIQDKNGITTDAARYRSIVALLTAVITIVLFFYEKEKYRRISKKIKITRKIKQANLDSVLLGNDFDELAETISNNNFEKLYNYFGGNKND